MATATHHIYIMFKNFLTGDQKLSQDFNTDFAFNINITISASDSDSMTPQPCQEGSSKFPQQGNNYHEHCGREELNIKDRKSNVIHHRDDR